MYEFKAQDVYDFANAINAETHEKGNELFFKFCPHCKGGGHDKDTFSINLTNGTFKCFRASCGYQGHFVELARDFNFPLEDLREKKYRKLPQKKIEIRDGAVKYLESRGISEAITRKYRVTTQKDNPDTIVFPFYDENNILQFIKYRNAKHNGKGAKEWCEKDTKPILFGMNYCEDFSTLVITEGEIDCLSVAECGIKNAVSVPTGAMGFTWLQYCWDWINQFKEIIVFGDYENGKITLIDKLRNSLKLPIKCVREEDYLHEKDANDILRKYGKEAIKKAVENAKVQEVKFTKRLADVKSVDLSKMPKFKTGIYEIDRALGGIYMGQLVLLSGKRGEGKLLADDTPVFTKKGWKKHGELDVGDEVIGRYGNFVKVTHIFPKYYANMKITLSNGEEFYCHENHEWVVELHDGISCVERILTAKEIYEKVKKGCSSQVKIIRRYPLDSETAELKVNPYTLGTCLRSDKKEYPQNIPTDYLVASMMQRLELLAGLMGNDECCKTSEERYLFSTTSVELRDTFVDLIHTFGWNCYLRDEKYAHNIEFITTDGEENDVKIQNVEYCNHKQGNCIEVEGGIYCVGKTMVPTHNSTFMSQISAEAVDQDITTFIYSGELPNYHFKNWFDLQVAGGNNISETQNEYGDKEYYLKPEVTEKINQWYYDKMFIFDNTAIEDDEFTGILDVVTDAIGRYGVKLICIDNLMTALDDDKNSDIFRQQSMFVKKLARMAKKYNVAIILIAHPKKSKEAFDNDTVSGSSDITNAVDVVMNYERCLDEDGVDSKISITKNRLTGKLLVKENAVPLKYSGKSKRVQSSNHFVENKEYGCFKKNIWKSIDEFDDLPF